MKSKVTKALLPLVFVLAVGTINNNHFNHATQGALSDDQSEETLKVAMAFMEAMGKGDMVKMRALMHDDMVWHNEGDSDMPWIGPWNGKEAILRDFLPAFGSNFQTIKWEPEEAFASENTAAFFGKMIGRLTATGQETGEFTYALRVKVEDGKVILWNWFEDSYAVSQAYHGQ